MKLENKVNDYHNSKSFDDYKVPGYVSPINIPQYIELPKETPKEFEIWTPDYTPKTDGCVQPIYY
jgi:hypothetical protein|tara:strand:- start:318 stop:512 length:195 start_codon:yes stop_codon:yes gene_type:complete